MAVLVVSYHLYHTQPPLGTVCVHRCSPLGHAASSDELQAQLKKGLNIITKIFITL